MERVKNVMTENVESVSPGGFGSDQAIARLNALRKDGIIDEEQFGRLISSSKRPAWTWGR
jgi:hypothetical protein